MMGILVVAGTRTPATAVWILVIPVLAAALPTAPAKNAAMMAVGGPARRVVGQGKPALMGSVTPVSKQSVPTV